METLRKERKGRPVRNAARVERYGEMVVRAFDLAMGFQFDVAFTDDAEDFAMIVLHKDAMLLTGKNKQKEAQGGQRTAVGGG